MPTQVNNQIIKHNDIGARDSNYYRDVTGARVGDYV